MAAISLLGANATMKIMDRVFGYLLILGALGHTIGTIIWLRPMSQLFIWSLGAALAAFVLGALNVLRAGRPGDRAVAAIAVIGTFAWMLVALAFGISIHHVLDPRPFSHIVISLVLVIFGVRSLTLAPKPVAQPTVAAR